MISVLDYLPEMPETKAFGVELPAAACGPLELRFVDPLVGPEWDQLVLKHPDATFFHSSSWARTLAKSYGHKPFYLSFTRSGMPQALVPMMEVNSPFTGRRGVALPFSDFCAPLLFEKHIDGFLISQLTALASENAWSHLQLRDPQFPYSSIEPAIQYFGHSLNLQEGAEAVFAGFSSSVRRAIRKAEKSKLGVEISQSWKSVLEFYDLHVRTRRRHGLPPQPLSFFHNLFDEAIRMGLGFVVQATLGKRSVSAAIFFRFGRTALYKYGASEPAAQELRANNLVMWEAIRYLARNTSESLHFGRTSFTDSGLRRFKSGWGTSEGVIGYLRWNTGSREWAHAADRSTGAHNMLFASMPSALNRLAGALLYPHLD